MRMIGQISGETNARAFSNFLFVQGIDNEVEAEKDGAWALWIHAEEEMERARGFLAEYQAHPGDAKFRDTAGLAEKLRERKEQEQAEYEKRLKQRRHLFRPMTQYGVGPFTFALILLSSGIFLFYYVANHHDDSSVMKLFIASFTVDGSYVRWDGLADIQHGQVWRLITPIFLHFSPTHLIFDMYILWAYGSMIEGRQSTLYLLSLTVVIAVGSNLTQYYLGGLLSGHPEIQNGHLDLHGGPMFGGMSGVDYGLMGYIWIRGKRDPGSGLYLDAGSVIMMIGWFFLCFTGWVGPIANGCHTGGLLIGMLWGWLASLKHR